MPETKATSTASENRLQADAEPRDSGTMPADSAAAPKVDEMPTGPAPSLARVRIGILLAMLLAGVAVAAMPTYDWWRARQAKFYDDACESAAAAESWENLKAIATQWVEWDPKASQGWIHLADSHLKLSELDKAVDALAQVDNSYPAVLQLLEVRGDLLFSELNRPYDAVENWQRMLEIDERYSVARQRLIYFYAITMQPELMREQVLRAMELESEPLESYAYLLLAYEVAFSDGLRLTNQWLETYPDDETLQVAAAVYFAQLSPDETILLFQSAVAEDGDLTLVNELLDTYPHNLEILAFHLDKATYEGDQQRVVELLKMCPPSAENDCRFWRYRGSLLLAQDRPEEGARAIERCLELNPLDWRGRQLLAGALRQLGRPEDASREAELSFIGKELHQELLERPNARAVDAELLQRMYQYTLRTGPTIVAESLSRRIQSQVQ